MIKDKLLHGHGTTDRITAVHQETDSTVRITRRLEDGTIEEHTEEFYPMLWVTEKALSPIAHEFTGYRIKELDGDLHYKWLIVTESANQFWNIRRVIRDRFGDASQYYLVPNMETQYLMQSGETMHNGMRIDEVLRMQIDIEVRTDHGFPNSKRTEDEIIVISMSDTSGWEKVLHTAEFDGDDPLERCLSERDMLMKFVKYVHIRNPDVLEFHNGFIFDFPYIRDRCEMLGVRFAIGRDGSEPNDYDTQVKFAEKEIDYTNFDVAGRSLVDTYFLARDYDVYKRDLPSYGLKAIAQHFGLAPEDREYVAGDDITRLYEEDPAKLLRYALHDVYETRALSNFLLPASFELSKLVPLTLQRTILAGTSSKLEMMMIREYLRQRHSLPSRDGPGGYVRGGYTEIFQRGVYGDGNGSLCYADVDSLYPSIMLNYDIQPSSDDLGVFPRLLQSLTDMRFEAKDRMKKLRAEGNDALANQVDAEQSSHKILINSAYGMLGFKYALFSDMSEADRVTFTGQGLLKEMIGYIVESGGDVILCDTDGVLFELPWRDMSDEDVDIFIARISEEMPEGINVSNDGRFDRVFSYRKKNYVLLPAGADKVKIKGQSFKGRSMAKFEVHYIKEIAKAFITGDVQRMADVHEETKRRIVQGDWHVDEFKKRSTLKKSLRGYQEGVDNDENKNPMPQYEVAWMLSGRGHEIHRGDIINWFVSGSGKGPAYKSALPAEDWEPGMENTDYYLKRLKTLRKKWKHFFSEGDFEKVFSMNLQDAANGGNLFGSTPPVGDVEIVNSVVNPLPNE